MRRPVLVLLALLPLAACSLAPSTSNTSATGQSAATTGTSEVAYYTCPMHPSIQQPGPGSCPICGMTLTPVTHAELATGAVRVDAQRRGQFGIELEAAAVRHMGSSLQVPAVVGWDPDGLSDVTVRASGWVKQVNGAPGESVRSGQVLFTLFSPELVAAQDDLLRATTAAADGDASAAARRDAARLRLTRLGLAGSEIDAIVREGHTTEEVPVRAPHGGIVLDRTVVEGGMVSPGQTLYRLGDLSTVWVEGAVPEDQVGALAAGQAVDVSATGLDAPLRGTVERVLSQVDATTRTARVRVTVRNPDGKLRPDQWATLRVDIDGGDHLSVPESAILYTGPRRVVFVDTGDDLLAPRDVVTGMKSDGYVEILDGLAPGELVVRAGNFLVAADSRLKKGGQTGHQHGGSDAAVGAGPDAPAPTAPPGHDMSTMEGR